MCINCEKTKGKLPSEHHVVCIGKTHLLTDRRTVRLDVSLTTPRFRATVDRFTNKIFTCFMILRLCLSDDDDHNLLFGNFITSLWFTQRPQLRLKC